jgi:large subunit ribosomal protein L10
MKKSNGALSKQKQSEQLSKKISGYKTVCLAEAHGFDSDSYEQIKKSFRGKADIIYTNKVIVQNALKLAKSPLADSAASVRMPVLLLSDQDPFEISKTIMANKTYTTIKAGQTASEDITLPSGPTPFPPGPMLSQFSSVGVKTKNEGGKISIVSDTTVVKKGEPVSEKIATILSSMDITPNELMLSIDVAWNGGIIFKHDVLYRPIEEYRKDVVRVFSSSLSLSMARGILNRYSVKPIIQKIYIGVKYLSLDVGIVSSATIKELLLKAHLQENSLSKKLGG